MSRFFVPHRLHRRSAQVVKRSPGQYKFQTSLLSFKEQAYYNYLTIINGCITYSIRVLYTDNQEANTYSTRTLAVSLARYRFYQLFWWNNWILQFHQNNCYIYYPVRVSRSNCSGGIPSILFHQNNGCISCPARV